MVLVTSYTWKAASLVGTAYNPGVTTSKAFGINTFRRSTPGSTDICQILLNPDVVLVFDDECSFTDQGYMVVSARPLRQMNDVVDVSKSLIECI